MATTLLEPEIAAAYNHCRDITRREAKNFYFGFISLPSDKRHAIYAAYAFSRECDDDSDDEATADAKRAAIATTRARLDECYAGTGSDPVLVALHHAAIRYRIPKEYFGELIAGVEMDLEVARYATFDELRRYCYRVASTIGLICLQIFGYQDEQAREFAIDLGIALQLTNILRDVREDADRGRIYLPLDELKRFGYSEADLLARQYNDAFRQLMAFQAERARRYFASGTKLLPLLDVRARACTATMGGIYWEILQRIEAADYAVFETRVSLSGTEKLGLTGRTWLDCLRGEVGFRAK
ncbi:MAG: presqualene diphosphate synthase HpnD [Chloroflexota bacterium]|nr:presqualene diphosphate synthase HpnD [Chloroflexota bacterium]